MKTPKVQFVQRLVLVAAVLIAVVFAWRAPLDAAANQQVDAGFKRALLSFASARALNAIISVVQGTEVAVEPAGIGALQLLGALTTEVAEETIDFLSGMQTEEGGLRANTRIPVADLLSTFTGVVTLTDLRGLDAIDPSAALRFARVLERPDGGFCGAIWDADVDVEYTFYGLGCLGLLSAPAAAPQQR